HGTLVSFGVMSGEPMRIPAGGLIYKEATVKGFWGSKVSQAMAVEDKRRLVGELLKRAAGGELNMPVEKIFALDDIAQAAKAGAGSGRNGKVLLRP
ncbi:alcohol dehydrogenase, partial [Streptomyces sp. PRKS01-65]|nr:alcohol dehydrogenase [Streptomyces harenosi]